MLPDLTIEATTRPMLPDLTIEATTQPMLPDLTIEATVPLPRGKLKHRLACENITHL